MWWFRKDNEVLGEITHVFFTTIHKSLGWLVDGGLPSFSVHGCTSNMAFPSGSRSDCDRSSEERKMPLKWHIMAKKHDNNIICKYSQAFYYIVEPGFVKVQRNCFLDNSTQVVHAQEPQTLDVSHMNLPHSSRYFPRPATTAERMRAVRRDGRAFHPVVSEYISTLLCASTSAMVFWMAMGHGHGHDMAKKPNGFPNNGVQTASLDLKMGIEDYPWITQGPLGSETQQVDLKMGIKLPVTWTCRKETIRM